MNKNFKDLILVAQQKAAAETQQNSFAYESLVYEKFAELLVEECLKVSNQTADLLQSTNSSYAEGIMSNNLAIRKHFGL